ncbi:hypothetical protein NGB36_08465 [Streptomyces sp. RB6PN25]|uniref:DUF1801 domain-containing protein n=1 Tax=Streptomyces humicola TaxID=2953240 RepID=A0ABT1PVP6_9ACTN|nr:hypothetical protein [Streptomyces humicola]MCQ4080632.1 hypothetical protein [Streptomyces humicola]
MARLKLDGQDLLVQLSWWERIAAQRREVRVPLIAVGKVAIQPDWWRVLRGVPERGLFIPGTLYLGVWRHRDGQDFFAMRPRHGTVAFADLHEPSPYARIAASLPDAQATTAALRTAMSRAAAATAAASAATTAETSASRPPDQTADHQGGERRAPTARTVWSRFGLELPWRERSGPVRWPRFGLATCLPTTDHQAQARPVPGRRSRPSAGRHAGPQVRVREDVGGVRRQVA